MESEQTKQRPEFKLNAEQYNTELLVKIINMQGDLVALKLALSRVLAKLNDTTPAEELDLIQASAHGATNTVIDDLANAYASNKEAPGRIDIDARA